MDKQKGSTLQALERISKDFSVRRRDLAVGGAKAKQGRTVRRGVGGGGGGVGGGGEEGQGGRGRAAGGREGGRGRGVRGGGEGGPAAEADRPHGAADLLREHLGESVRGHGAGPRGRGSGPGGR